MADFSGAFKKLVLSSVFLSACTSLSPIHKSVDPDYVDQVPIVLNKFIEASKPNRTVGSVGHERAFEFIKNQFDEIATEIKGRVIVHDFTPDVDFALLNYENDFSTLIKPRYPKSSPVYKKWRTFTDQAKAFLNGFRNVRGRNIILEIPGRSKADEVIYIGAHYDTINNDPQTLKFLPHAPAPGADDNASGIAALLTAARELRREKPERTLRFVAFDFEEIFFLGSYALAKDLSAQKPRWMRPGEVTTSLFNLEMIGWSQTKLPDHPVLKLYTRENGKPGAAEDLHLAQDIARGANILKSPLKLVILPNGFNRSDNWSFWQKSFPAVCISEDWENDFNKNHYHTPTDTIATLNLDFLKETTRILTESVAELTRDAMMEKK